jgi:hypothetical protein
MSGCAGLDALLALACGAGLCLALGCGDRPSPPTSIAAGGAAASGGSGGRGGAASAGAGGRDVVDAGANAGASSQGGSTSLPADCPTPAPLPVPGQTVAIQSINFASSQIVLRNVSDVDQTILGGRLGWQWCNWPMYWAITELGDIVLGPGETFAFTAINNQNGPVPLYSDGGEMAIYTTTGSFNESDYMVSFTAWGEVDSIREPFAVEKNLWTFGERIDIRPGHNGFVATGFTNRGAGYTSVRPACLVAPPNP